MSNVHRQVEMFLRNKIISIVTRRFYQQTFASGEKFHKKISWHDIIGACYVIYYQRLFCIWTFNFNYVMLFSIVKFYSNYEKYGGACATPVIFICLFNFANIYKISIKQITNVFGQKFFLWPTKCWSNCKTSATVSQ